MRMNKGPLGLARLALVPLAIAGIVGAGASASGGTAVVAKKKCKKHKKQADSAKKKKCKKKKPVTGDPNTIVRATLAWSNGGTNEMDVDLHVFDASGNLAGNGSDAIPQSVLTPDVE